MLRFFICCFILILPSGVFAQKTSSPPSVNRMPFAANGNRSQLYFEDYRSKIRLLQLKDSSGDLQGVMGINTGKVQHRNEKSLPAKGATPRLANNTLFSAAVNKTASVVCYDTSSRFFIKSDSYRLFAHQSYKTADGNLLVSGECISKSAPYLWGGFLMKCDEYGNLLWAQRYDSADHVGDSYINYSKVIELKDGSVVMAGRTNNLVTENYDLIVTKTDNMGLIQWSKVYKSRLWGHGDGSSSYYVLEDLKQDPYSGDIFISGGFWEAGKSIIRINQSDGKIIWSNLYQYYNNGYQVFDNSFGMTFEPNEIRLFGTMTLGHTLISVHRINKADGDTLSAKLFMLDDPLGYKLEFLKTEGVTVLDNGNYVLSGECYDDYPVNYDPPTRPLNHAAVFELDRNLDFVQAYSLKSQIQSNVYDTRLSVLADGSGLFTMREWSNPFNANFYYVQFKNGFITRQRKRTYQNEGIAFETNAVRLKDGGDLLIRAIEDSLETESQVEFLKLHTSDTSSNCLGVDDNSTSIQFFNYVPASWNMDSIGRNVFLENPNKTITGNTFNTALLPGCYQVSHCDSLKLVALVTTICLGQELPVIARKNKDCGTIIPFGFDYSVADAVRDNDSTLRFQFKAPWSGYIYASLQGCSLMQDSVYVRVLKAPTTLNLGPDSTLCPGNTMVLNAHEGYATYQWQDGSADSVYTVTQPGTYFVKTTSACGDAFSDTILVTAHPPISFDAGADRIKCNNDTVHIDAPSGFISYSWWPSYNISSTISQSIIVNPTDDTSYFVKAELTPGCFAYDTIKVKVHHSPAINLGNDTSFCYGKSALLNAGAGFDKYQWNDGSSQQTLSVSKAGTFTVTGTTAEGCPSNDTLNVIKVWPLPLISIDHNSELCQSSVRILDPGNFSSYLWQDGSTSRQYTVSSAGSYYVQVTDYNGCVNADTVSITTILPSPSNFLTKDTSICSYGTAELKPARSFASYTWSNGSSASKITVGNAGKYWLQVRDAKGCIGSDTVIVSLKDCMVGLRVPTAFTPNRDATNDIFRALLFGNVKSFDLTVYNRWGQVVFHTTDRFKGWDGTVNGVDQKPDVFVWLCKYQLQGDEQKVERGTVTLIR